MHRYVALCLQQNVRKEIHPRAKQNLQPRDPSGNDSFLIAKGFRVIPGKHRCLFCFTTKKAFKNSSKGQEETIQDGSCDRQPFTTYFHFVRSHPQAGSKVLLLFMSMSSLIGMCR